MGAVFGRDNETHALYVREVPPGLAADTAGLLPGDQVLMIDGYYVRDLDGHELRRRLRGEIGSEVSLTIARGEEIRHLRIVRSPLREHKELQPREERIGP